MLIHRTIQILILIAITLSSGIAFADALPRILVGIVDIGSYEYKTLYLPQTGQTKCYDEFGTEISCSGTGQDGDIQEGELLVKFKSGVVKTSSQKSHQAVGASVIKSYTLVRNLEHVRLPKGLSVKDAINQYMSDPNVEYAEPNYLTSRTLLPTTILFSLQYC